MTDKVVLAALMVFGFCLALAISFVAEPPGAAIAVTEPWDSWIYFAFGLPAMALAAGIAGYIQPPRTWSYGFAVVAGSLAWTIGVTRAPFSMPSLSPVGCAFSIPIALGCGLAARLGVWLRRRHDR